ncbi:MAG: transcription-repair coupling factor [Phycisphaerae bacterium]|nr:transcription-repair coupling factor [Phycisphaerae bacterium]
MGDLLQIIAGDPALVGLADLMEARRRVVATGAVGASTALVAAALARRTGRMVVLVVAHLDEGDDFVDAILEQGGAALRFPALEAVPGESGAALDLFAERLETVRRVLAPRGEDPAPVVVAPIQALMQSVPAPSRLDALSLRVVRGAPMSPQGLARWLDAAGYSRQEAADEPGDFALRGGILDVFPAGGQAPVRVEFLGDAVERVSEIDPDTMGSDRALAAPLTLVCADPKGVGEQTCPFLELVPATSLALIAETAEVVEQGRGYYERVVDARDIFGPPAVLRLMETRFHALAEMNHFSAGAAGADAQVTLPVTPLPTFARDAGEAVAELVDAVAQPAAGGSPVRPRAVVLCQTEGERARFDELLGGGAVRRAGPEGDASEALAALRARVESRTAFMGAGFGWRVEDDGGAPGGLLVVPYHELLGRAPGRRRAGARLRSSRALDTFLEFAPGDLVVHADHGIARYAGLSMMSPRKLPGRGKIDVVKPGAGLLPPGEPEEYLTLEFAGRSRLHVPASQIDLVQRYVGGGGARPPLSTLGGQKWKGQKERVAGAVRDMAAELLRVRAARESTPGIRFPDDTAWQREFEAEFPYQETDDQIAALAEIKRDMGRARPMDRLICGDVGFGKTELAIRAAFKAVEYGKQVAVLVPTTVLAEQHERTFKERFADYPFRIESLSRFKTGGEARAILGDARAGRVDILIGTHRLLSGDVDLADLGLVVVDEEQRFGVEHKERLLRLRLTVDVLTLSATPIPRTLHMSLLGLRDISSLATPPMDRRAIVTEVIPYNEKRVAQAIARELSREGQVFYVHNRVHDIRDVAERVRALAPGARIVVGHGQMSDDELEDVMLRFTRRQADILVSTTIIESGVDIPTANTMIIDDADRFGLADLHQLRGRVGRSKHRGYCYLLLPRDRALKEIAVKRLRAIEQYSMLGAGFKIAMRDLETRGAGNLLGAEQSGHIAAVGYEMYCRLLEKAVHELNRQALPVSPASVSLELGMGASIPKTYIASDARRLETYRRIATAGTPEDLAKVAGGLTDAYGPPPKPVQRLLGLAELRIACVGLGIRGITIRDRDVVFRVAATLAVAPRLRGGAGSVVELPGKAPGEPAEVYFRPPPSHLEPETLLAILRRRLAPAASAAAAVRLG